MIHMIFIPPDDYSGFVRYSSSPITTFVDRTIFCVHVVPGALPLAKTTFTDWKEIIDYGLQPILVLQIFFKFHWWNSALFSLKGWLNLAQGNSDERRKSPWNKWYAHKPSAVEYRQLYFLHSDGTGKCLNHWMIRAGNDLFDLQEIRINGLRKYQFYVGSIDLFHVSPLGRCPKPHLTFLPWYKKVGKKDQ
jgi:hypothetical protein